MKKLLKKSIVILMTMVMTVSSFLITPLTTFATDGEIPSNKISSLFEYYVGKNTFFYDDAYFNMPASEYDDSFATTSLCLAMSAFNNPSVGYTDGERCARDMMEKMGFSNISANGYYAEKPQSDSMGVIIGSKEVVRTDGKIQPIIAMALRGGNYESEWAGNVTVGASKEHTGFSDARDIATTWLNKYLRECTGRYSGSDYVAPKIWIVGYSRASATANLTGCFVNCVLNNEGPEAKTMIYTEMRDNLNRLGVTTDDVYVYCFEVPQGLTDDSKYNPSVQSNIWCLANPADPVPYVAPSDMGFYRAGTTIDPTEGVSYDEFMAQMMLINPRMAKDWAASEAQNDFHAKSTNIVTLILNIFGTAEFSDAWFNGVGDDAGEFSDSLVNDFLVEAMEYVPSVTLKGIGKSAREIYTDSYQEPIQIVAKALMASTKEQKDAFVAAIGDAAGKNINGWEIADLIAGFTDFVWGGKGGSEIYLKLSNLLRDILEDFSKDKSVSGIISSSEMEILKNSYDDLAALVAALYITDLSMVDGYQHIATAKTYAAELFLPHYPEYVLAYMRARDPNYNGKNVEQYQLKISSADAKSLKNIQLNVYTEQLTSPYQYDQIASVTKDGLNTSYEFSDGWWEGSATYSDNEITLYLNRNINNDFEKDSDYRFEIINNSTDGSRQKLKIDYNILKEGKDGDNKTQDFEKTAIPVANDDVLKIIPRKDDRSYATLEKYIQVTPVFVDENLNEIEEGSIVVRTTEDGRKADFRHFLVTDEHSYEVTAPSGTFLNELAIPAYDDAGNVVIDPERDRAYTRHVFNPSSWDWNECSMPLYIVCSDRFAEGKVYADITYQHRGSSKKLIDEIDTTIPLKLANLTKKSEDVGTGEQYMDAEPGDTIEISFDKSKIPSGKVFNGWSVKSNVYVEKTEEETKLTFTMPEGGAEVHAMIGDSLEGVTLTFTGSWAHPTDRLPDEIDGYWRLVYIDPEYADVSYKNAANCYPAKHIYQKMDKDRAGKAWIKAPGYSSEASGDMVFDHWEVFYTDTGEKCTDRIAVETYYNSRTETYETQMANPNGVTNEVLVLENIKKSLTVVPVFVPAEYEVHVRYSTRSQQTLRFKAGETVTLTDRKMLGYEHEKWTGYYNPLQETVDKYGNVTRSYDETIVVDMGEQEHADGVWQFTMPKGDVYVTATNKLAEYEVSWTGDAIQTSNGARTYHIGDEVVIVPDNIGHSQYLADVWVESGLDFPEDAELVTNGDGEVISLSFTMEASDVQLDCSVLQYPEHDLKLENATAEYTDGYEIIALPEDIYTVYEYDILTLKAKVPTGSYFKNWEVLEGTVEIFDDDNTGEAYIVMPDEDVTIKAVLGTYEEIDEVALDFTSSFAGNRLLPESAFVTSGEDQVQEDSVEIEEISDCWRENPGIFGYPYKFGFVLTPEEGYYFGENTEVKLHDTLCTVTVQEDGSALVTCELTTDPAYVTKIEDVKGLEGLPAHTTLDEIKDKMPKVANAYVEERHSWINPDITWDWDNLEQEDGSEFIYDDTSEEEQVFYVNATNLDFSDYVGDLQEYYENGLLIASDVTYNHRARVTVLAEDKVSLPYVSNSNQPGTYDKNVSVSLACDTEDAVIYYLVDQPGKTLTSEEILAEGTEYDDTAIDVDGTEGTSVSETIYAIAAVADGEGTTKLSEVAVLDYTIELPAPIEYFDLTVINGSGSGTYPFDGKTVVGVKADAPDKNAAFKGFTVKEGTITPISGGLENDFCNFYMPESNVTMVATYEIDALAFTVDKPSSGKQLSGDVIQSENNPKGIQLIERGCGSISYYDPSEAEWTGTAKHNTRYTGVITISAPEGYELSEDTVVTINGERAVVLENQDGTIQAAIEFPKTAKKIYNLTVINGTAYSQEPEQPALLKASNGTGEDYEELPLFDGVAELYGGELIQIEADEIPGKVFVGWKESSGTLTLEGNPCEFIMPSQDITITALYKDILSDIELSLAEPESPDWILSGKAKVESEGIVGPTTRAKWTKDNKEVSVVEEDGRYLVSFEVTVEDGFILDENATATINGKPCLITVLDNGERAVLGTAFELEKPEAPDDPVDPDDPVNPVHPVDPDEPDSPDTGDHANVGLYVILMLLSLILGISAIIVGMRKRRKR
ncbi:MAG: hypothetical protein MJ086_04185 [Lachnospiraceae bacterium]|nr:hypothetical protein [Lachnospiraceae bacterium]